MPDFDHPSGSDGDGTDRASPDDPERSADGGVIDWLAVMGNPAIPAADDVAEGPGGVAEVGGGEVGGAEVGDGEAGDDDDDLVIPMKRIAQIAAVLVLLYLVANFIDVWVASRSSYDGEAQAAVVLGAAQYNGEPSEALQGRLDQAAALYGADRVDLVVVTGGGQAEDITTEAKTGYDYLRDTASIPDEDLRLEVDGTSTYLSLAAAARFLADEDVEKVILVTDPYHAKRSKLIAEEVGLDAEVSPTDSSVTLRRLVQESGATAIGRLIGFRRLDAYIDL